MVSTPRNQLIISLGRGVGIIFVRVHAGEFWMGTDARADHMGHKNEKPQHKVYLEEFWIGKFPVTNRQYKAYIDANEFKEPKGFPVDKPTHPVCKVSWEDAVKFCQWASRVSGKPIRLPTEAEWEKAARGTDKRIFPWGNQLPDLYLCNFNNNIGNTTPVGIYSPNGDSPYGCADMSGNIWEWVNDYYDEKYYQNSPSHNPPGPVFRVGIYNRVIRGGCYLNLYQNLRVSNRGWEPPGFRGFLGGFRCAC